MFITKCIENNNFVRIFTDLSGNVYDRIRERPHLVMFFSAVQPDIKQLSLAKWYIRANKN